MKSLKDFFLFVMSLFIELALEEAMGIVGVDEATEGKGGDGQGAQQVEGIGRGGGLEGLLHYTADLDTQHGDLIFEADEGMAVEVEAFFALELLGVKSVL
jgi:hypothetical protein